MNSTLHPKWDPTPIQTKLGDSSRILCSRPRPFDSACFWKCSPQCMYPQSVCFCMCLLPGYLLKFFTAQCPDNSMLYMRSYESSGAMKTANTTEFQIFLFSKAFGHSCHWAVALSWTGRRTQGLFLPALKFALFL